MANRQLLRHIYSAADNAHNPYQNHVQPQPSVVEAAAEVSWYTAPQSQIHPSHPSQPQVTFEQPVVDTNQQRYPQQQEYSAAQHQQPIDHQNPPDQPQYPIQQHRVHAQQIPHHANLSQSQQATHQQYMYHEQGYALQQQLQAIADAQLERDRVKDERLRRLRRIRKNFFNVPLIGNKYVVQQIIGEGASGVVCSALDKETGEIVAVKRISRGFDKVAVSVRLLRELKFLRLLRGHQNIVEIKDILLPSSTKDFNDVFVVFQHMTTDLSHMLRGQTKPTDDHIQYFTYQLLRGIHFLHSAGVFHRDLKPNNLLISQECTLCICDFGLARAAFDNDHDMVYWTDYVATRWYRAPELIMTHYTKYSTAIDMWSVGCILADMLGGGKPLFPGKDGYDQLQLMTSILGSPSEEAISKVASVRVREHFRQLPKRRPRPFSQLFPHANQQALSLLESLLQFDPAKRPTALEALSHPYFEKLFLGSEEPSGRPIPKTEFAFEYFQHTPEMMRKLLFEEIMLYHPAVSNECMQEFDRKGGFDFPSQADAFASAMKSVQEGIAQRRTSSLPKDKFKTIADEHRAKNEAEGKNICGTEGASTSENTTMAEVDNSSSSQHGRTTNLHVGSSSSWYGGSSRRQPVSYNPEPVMLAQGPFAIDDSASLEEGLDIVRVNSAGSGSIG